MKSQEAALGKVCRNEQGSEEKYKDRQKEVDGEHHL